MLAFVLAADDGVLDVDPDEPVLLLLLLEAAETAFVVEEPVLC